MTLPENGTFQVEALSPKSLAYCKGELDVKGDGELSLKLESSDRKPMNSFEFFGLVLRPVPFSTVDFYSGIDRPEPGRGGLLIEDVTPGLAPWLKTLKDQRGELLLGFSKWGVGGGGFSKSPESAGDLAQVVLNNLYVWVLPTGEKAKGIGISTGRGGTSGNCPSEKDIENLRRLARASGK